MPFRDITPNHPGTLKRARRKGFTKQRCTLPNLMHCMLLCSFVCVCIWVGVACKMAVCWQKLSAITETQPRTAFKLKSHWGKQRQPKWELSGLTICLNGGAIFQTSHQHSLITRLRSLRALINIHRRDYSLAKHYHCWLTGDCSEGQIFSGISIHVLILQACELWIRCLTRALINGNESNCAQWDNSSVPFFIFPSKPVHSAQ